jgi:hypothetical protein
MAKMDESQKNPAGSGGSRSTIAALIFIVVLVGGVYWAFEAIVQHNAMQNCIDSGRRDCDTRLNTP